MPGAAERQPAAGTLTLYGMPVSLYTGKARSYLRKQRLPHAERPPADPAYRTRVMPRLKRLIVPVVELPDGTLLQDTSAIIDGLEARFAVPLPCYPAGPKQKLAALALELFGDEGLLRMAMHYRWSHLADQEAFLRREFAGFVAPTAPLEEQDRLAAAPMAQMQSYLPNLGITTDSAPLIEAAYRELLDGLEAHFLKHPYLLGGRPSIGDFGLIGPLYAHLGRDPVPASLMRRRAPRTARWVERMNAPDPDMPEYPDHAADVFLPEDAVPETVLPLLALMARDHLPQLRSLVDFVDAWVAANGVVAGAPVTPKPARRALGMTRFSFRGLDIEVWAAPYTLWMLQRVTDAHAALSAEDRTAVTALFERAGLAELLTLKARRRVERADFIDVWGDAA